MPTASSVSTSIESPARPVVGQALKARQLRRGGPSSPSFSTQRITGVSYYPATILRIARRPVMPALNAPPTTSSRCTVSKADLSSIMATLHPPADAYSKKYNLIIALSISFASDLRATRDVQEFATALSVWNLQTNHLCINGSSTSYSHSPTWLVTSTLLGLLRDCYQTPGHTLLLLHYAGRGWLDAQGSLHCGTPGFSFEWATVEARVLAPTALFEREQVERTDVLCVVDSCFRAGTRHKGDGTRTVEVVAGRERGEHSDVESFTKMFTRGVENLLERGYWGWGAALLYEELLRQGEVGWWPVYMRVLGDTPIVVPMMLVEGGSFDPPLLMARVEMVVEEDIDSRPVAELVARMLDVDWHMQMEINLCSSFVNGKTPATKISCIVPAETWFGFKGLHGIKLIEYCWEDSTRPLIPTM